MEDTVKYKVKYGLTKVDVIHFKPPSMFKSSSEYILEGKRLGDNLQSKHSIRCSDDDYILVLTEQGYMKLKPNEYFVFMSNGKGFIYRALDFLATFEKIKR